ncbi:MAG: right-handed parallel beta-helix repeat-containing protein, partial [Thermoplasmata archaeon]|nr:right-handed parallel beta-helix repeat-containing protein [Thermoplasmata archaeon]
ILANCTEMVVENQNLSHGSVGIQLGFSLNVTISNNTCSNNRYGIRLDHSHHNTLFNNTCSNNARYGIYLRNSDSNTLTNNTCSNNSYGIYLRDSDSNTLFNNTCSNNGNGIYLYRSDSNTLTNNTCSNNGGNGIYLYSSDSNTLSNNTISGNIEGIRLERSSEGNVAHHNSIYKNTEYGINATENNGCTINATHNWWGDPSGPYHPANNSQGEGDDITDYVDFNPWLKQPHFEDYFLPEAIIDLINPKCAVEGEMVQFSGHGKAYNSITRYVWRSNINEELYNSTDTQFNLANLSNGTHTIYLKVQDNYGVWSEEVNTTLTINGKPVTKIIDISPNPAIKGETVTFTGEGTDDGFVVKYLWRTDEKVLYNGTDAAFSLSNLSAGNHTITLKVQDNSGALSEPVSASLTITAPNQPPVVTITSPKNRSKVSGKVTISGTASDPDGTVQRVEVSINGGDWILLTGITNWNYEWDTKKLKNGEYTINVRSYDGKNYSQEQSVNITVENKDDGGDGFIPGFVAVALIGAVVIGLLLISSYALIYRVKKKF